MCENFHMRKLAFIFVLSFAAAAPAHAEGLEVDAPEFSALLTTAMDWSQTRFISANLNSYHEKNIILGRSPDAGRVNRYFALSALNEIIFSRLLDDEDAMAFRVSIAVFESAVVVHNAAIGIKFGSFF